MSQGAVDSSVDMDRLNRNMPECGRQTRQVLQVSVCVCVLGRWGIGEEMEREKRNESEREREPEASLYSTYSQCIAQKHSQMFSLCQFPVWNRSLTQRVLSSSDNRTH